MKIAMAAASQDAPVLTLGATEGTRVLDVVDTAKTSPFCQQLYVESLGTLQEHDGLSEMHRTMFAGTVHDRIQD